MSSAELEMYRQYLIDQNKKYYVDAINKLNADLRNNLNALSRLYVRNKQAIANSLIAKYNQNAYALSMRLIQEINKAKAFVPTFTTPVIKQKKALLIGINYLGTPNELSGCVEDTTRMRNILKNCGFSQFNIITDYTAIKPTKSNILQEFKKLIMNATAGDLLVFYFSGHGSYTFDYSGDEVDRNDEIIISSDLQAVIDDDFRSILSSNMKEGVTVVGIFDSCFSGTMFDLKCNYFDSSNYESYTENNKVSECKGNVIMISGCMDSQTSSEAFVNGKAQGAVTWAFIESMNKNKNASWKELLRSMRDLLKSNGFDQIPQMSTDSFYDIDSKVFL
jgi:hypothetical protein